MPWLIHRRMQWLLDALCGAVACGLAYSLRFDFTIPPAEVPGMLGWAALLFLVTPLSFAVYGGYRATWQFFGGRDLARLAVRALPISLTLVLLRTLTPGHRLISYGVIIIEYGVVLGLSSSVRMLRRLNHELMLRQPKVERVLLVTTERTLLGAIRQLQPLYRTRLAGIITDDPSLCGMKVAGIPVFGLPSSLSRIISSQNIKLLFLCSADLPAIAEIMQVAADFDVTVKFLPSPQDLIANRVHVSKNLTADALRVGKRLADSELHPAVLQCLTGRTVLVTGAGGSIGSEIVRQVAAHEVKKLIVLDHDENALFEMLNELRTTRSLVPVITDIRDREAVRYLFDNEHPEIVLHAAAYKHVPMMESNPCEAVLNNVCGTRELAEAAVDFRAERLVMISSDKAVRPSSVMGATKRVAETVIQRYANALGASARGTHFACVRFGNVLGSRGSVLPIFLKQIAAGQPLTITHQEMTRYFMTIPQAVRLVLQAATLASSGDIYMLDMGDPVRIVDFARDLIELSGLTPGKDIHIEVVGTRPGEKLHEQLWSEDAHVSPTVFTHVYRVKAPELHPSFLPLLDKLEHAARQRRSSEVRTLLHNLPIDFLTEQTDPIAAVLTTAPSAVGFMSQGEVAGAAQLKDAYAR